MAATIRLDKLVANLGYGSRREVHAMAARGRITFSGQLLRDASAKLSFAEARSLEIDGAAIDPLPGLILLINKPLGVTCSHKETGPLVYDLLPDRWRRRDPPMSTVGRLDKETSGLLLMTDDGVLLHRIISPKSRVMKTYRAKLARPLNGDEAGIFARGDLVLEGEATALLPARLEVLHPTEAMVSIVEGRYHQVRRMFAAVGNHVEALHRTQMGALALPEDLAEGTYRILHPTDVESIFEA